MKALRVLFYVELVLLLLLTLGLAVAQFGLLPTIVATVLATIGLLTRERTQRWIDNWHERLRTALFAPWKWKRLATIDALLLAILALMAHLSLAAAQDRQLKSARMRYDDALARINSSAAEIRLQGARAIAGVFQRYGR